MQTNLHSSDFPVFTTIWDAIKTFTRPTSTTEQTAMDNAFFLVIDMLEEMEDTWIFPKNDAIPYEFIEDCVAKAKAIFGMNDQITVKLYLLLIFWSLDPKTSILEFLNAAGSTDDLKRMFPSHVPRPNTGLFLDTNLDEDSLRDIRYFFMLALIYRDNGDFELAQLSLQEANVRSIDAQDDPVYKQRRGPSGSLIDLVHNHARILRVLAELTHDHGLEAEPLSYLAQSATLELAHRRVLGLDHAYVEYLKFVSTQPGFEPAELQRRLNNYPLAARHVSSVALTLRIIAALTARNGDPRRATKFLNVGLQYTQEQLANLNHDDITESVFEFIIELSIYKLAAERLTITIDGPVNSLERLEAFLELIEVVRRCDLKVVTDSMYPQAFKEVTTLMDNISRHKKVMVMGSATRAVFQRAADELSRYRNDFQITLLDEAFAPTSADVFEVLARFYLRHNDQVNFLTSLLTSLSLEQLCGKRMNRDASLEKKARKVLKEKAEKVELILEGHVDENSERAKVSTFLNNIHHTFLLVVGQIKSPVAARTPVSLTEQSRMTILARMNEVIITLRTFMQL